MNIQEQDVETIKVWCLEHPQYERCHGVINFGWVLQEMTTTKLNRVRLDKPGIWPCEHPPLVVWQCGACGSITYSLYPGVCTRCTFGRLVTYGGASQFDDEWQPEHAAESVTGRYCPICGKDISHRRPQARTCGDKCRKALDRQATEKFS